MKKINTVAKKFLFLKIADHDEPQQITPNIINKPDSIYFKSPVKLISATRYITEEQAIEYFTGKSYLYSTDISGAWEGQVYSCDEDEETIALTAKDAMFRLIEANGLDVSKNYAIIELI